MFGSIPVNGGCSFPPRPGGGPGWGNPPQQQTQSDIAPTNSLDPSWATLAANPGINPPSSPRGRGDVGSLRVNGGAGSLPVHGEGKGGHHPSQQTQATCSRPDSSTPAWTSLGRTSVVQTPLSPPVGGDVWFPPRQRAMLGSLPRPREGLGGVIPTRDPHLRPLATRRVETRSRDRWS